MRVDSMTKMEIRHFMRSVCHIHVL